MRTSTRWATTAYALTLLTAVGGLTACSAADDGVASARGGDAAASSGASSDKAADFVACLADAGVPATVDADGTLSFGGPDSETLTGIAADADAPSEVSVDGVDITDHLRACEAKVPGYVWYRTATSVPQEARDAALAWVACARQNEVTSIADPEDGVVTLPDSLTVADATLLAEACPLADLPLFPIVVGDDPDDAALQALEILFGSYGTTAAAVGTEQGSGA